MKHNYKKLQILSAIDVLNRDNSILPSRNKDITRLIGGFQKKQTTSMALSRYFSWGYIKRKKMVRYDKTIKRQRQVCYALTDMGERILTILESRYYAGKDLNLRNAHVPQDCCFADEGVLLEGYNEMKEEGLI